MHPHLDHNAEQQRKIDYIDAQIASGTRDRTDVDALKETRKHIIGRWKPEQKKDEPQEFVSPDLPEILSVSAVRIGGPNSHEYALPEDPALAESDTPASPDALAAETS